MAKWAQGQYRTPATEQRPAMAYVVDGRIATFVSEEVYRLKGYEPAFDKLPTEDEYNA
jgi:hypothetical protein